METEANKIRLSVIIPCFNEENTLEECVNKLRKIEDSVLSLQVIVVDDASTDNSPQIGKCLAEKFPDTVFVRQKKNMGKGAAIRTGLKSAEGDFVAVQDADLEYDPDDLRTLLTPLINGKADVVIGSRFLTVGPHRVLYFWHSIGNKLITFFSNMLSDLNLTDIESGYKIFRRDVFKKIEIEENRFGFEPEIIAKAAHMKLRIYEMGISYSGRTYEEGKKIGYKDGLWAMYCIFRYNIFKAPFAIQLLIHILFGVFAILLDFILFRQFISAGLSNEISSLLAFSTTAAIGYPILRGGKVNYRLIHPRSYIYIIIILSLLDLGITSLLTTIGANLYFSKTAGMIFILIFNFIFINFIAAMSRSSGRLFAGKEAL